MSLSGKRVLITGGGSGAGADLARGFAGAGAEVVISGRRAEVLREVAEPLGAAWVRCSCRFFAVFLAVAKNMLSASSASR